MWVYLIQTFSTSHTYKALFTHFKLLKHSSKTHFPKELSWLGNTCLLLLTAQYFVLHCLMLQLPANLLNPFQWVWQTHGPHPTRARARMLKLLQSCATLCDPMDCNPLGSSVHGILQARILEWVAMPSSRASSRPRDRTCVSCSTGRFFTTEPSGEPYMYPCCLHQKWDTEYFHLAKRFPPASNSTPGNPRSGVPHYPIWLPVTDFKWNQRAITFFFFFLV